jgi:Xaa-Pro aminopeptidase
MDEANIDFYYVPSSDPHQNEYVPDTWQRRRFITGFTGSAGDALIGQTWAGLWTDGRYFLQAEQELDASLFTLMRQGQDPSIESWLPENTSAGVRVGVDPLLLPIQRAQQLESVLKAHGGALVALSYNLVDGCWPDRPAMPSYPAIDYSVKYAGLSATEKLTQIRDALKTASADALLVTHLDSTAWLYNIRSPQTPYSPAPIGYAIVTTDEAFWFTELSTITPELSARLTANGIQARHYEDFLPALYNLKGTVWIDPKETSWATYQALSTHQILEHTSPILLAKACKNPIECSMMVQAHVFDGIALARFFHWLETHWQEGVTECSAAVQLEKFRREHPDCVDLSFSTISGFGPHSAIIHYSSTPKTDVPITDKNLYLLDSGGQYWGGTTDVTRTIHLGTPTAEQKRAYTRVLQGHLALQRAVFPKGLSGDYLDILARQFLWQDACDFNHGTGHGVGAYLFVHEGPQSIARRPGQVPLMPGMVVSNEPGVYLPGQWGIRIENLCVIETQYDTTASITGHGPFYRLKDLTLTPYCRRLMDTSLLSALEIKQLNHYHERVRETIMPHITDIEIKAWLEKATEALKI